MNTTGQFLQPWLGGLLPSLYSSSYWWTVFGFVGNILFGSRFILQWLASEKRNKLVVPAYFWHLSFWGSLLNLVYAFHLDSAPLIIGVVALPFIYARNLVLLGRQSGESVQAPKNRNDVRSIPAGEPAVLGAA